MEKISKSFEALKTIYLEDVQKDFDSDLSNKFSAAPTSEGFDKVPYWQLFTEKFSLVMQKKSPELVQIFSVITQEILEIIESGKSFLTETHKKEENLLIEANKELTKTVSELQQTLNEKESEILALKSSVSQNPDPQISNESLENELKGLKGELEKASEQNQSLVQQLEKLQSENQDLIFTNNELQIELEDLKSSKTQPAKVLTFTPNPQKTIPLNLNPIKTLSQDTKPPPQDLKPATEDPKPSELQKSLNPAPKPTKLLIPKNDPKKTLIKPRPVNSHDLTIRQLKETIDDIYNTKQKFDDKCQDTRQPRETMDQFLYTYLNQKYGLKSLIAEWSVLILKAIDKYESTDAEISLFCKILNHKVDEDYRLVFEKLKENMKQFLRAKLQIRDPYMREAQLNGLVKEKIAGVLDEDEWGTIIVSMFSQEEAEYMIGNFKTVLEQNSGKLILARKSKNPLNKTDASYTELQNFILTYDLSAREALLTPFMNYFSSSDFDKNGILSTDEFRTLCTNLGLENDYSRLIAQVDRYNCGFLNFSDCVTLFTYELVDLPDQPSMSVIHYLFFHSTSKLS